jgi:hypothetical protein
VVKWSPLRGGETSDLLLWNISEDLKIFQVTPGYLHDGFLQCTLTFTKDDKNLISHSRKHMAIWNLKGECEYLSMFDSVVDVFVGNQALVIFDARKGHLESRDIPSGRLLREVTIRNPIPLGYRSLSPDGKVMAARIR